MCNSPVRLAGLTLGVVLLGLQISAVHARGPAGGNATLATQSSVEAGPWAV